METRQDLERELAELREYVRTLQRALAQRDDPAAREQRGDLTVGLSEREALLTEAERIAHMGSWVWNVGPNTVFWSDELFRILGYDPDTDRASTEAFFARVHPGDRLYVEEASQRGIATGLAERVHFRVKRPDGTVRHVQMDGAMVFDPDGSLRRAVGTVLDLTTSVAAAALQRRVEQTLREAESIADLGILDIDLVTGDRRWSAGLRAMLGVGDGVPPTEAEFLARVHPADRKLLIDAREQMIESGQQTFVEFRVLRPDGELRYVRSVASARRDPDGSLVGIVSLGFDVTEQRLLEQRLQSAEKLEAIGRLAGGVAHDLNNLMMVVSAISSQIVDSAPDAAGDLQRTVDAASRLTQRLLSVSGQAQLDIRAVECNQLVEEVLSKARSVLGEGIELVRDLSAPAVGIDVDAHQIEQALMNLLINARDALAGEGTITLSTCLLSEDRIEVAIADDGSGMSEEVEAKAFDPFFSTKAAGRGTGLGLSLVRGTVERHGGSVHLDTCLGKGTRIAMTLPCRPLAERPGDDAGETAAPVRSLRVLVVDDDAMVRGALRQLLEAEGHSVEEAAQPSECLSIAAKLSPTLDLLVSDLVMPEMLGPALVAELRQRQICPDRVLYVTGYGSSAESMLEPDDVVLCKPFHPKQLREAIEATSTAGIGTGG